jgi:hypothetical protein
MFSRQSGPDLMADTLKSRASAREILFWPVPVADDIWPRARAGVQCEETLDSWRKYVHL